MTMKKQQIISPASCVSAREELNLSQAKVASDTGVSRPYLSQFEGGRRVLEDKHQNTLLDYFVGQGWQPPIEQEKSEEQPLPYVIRDGFVVLDSINEEELEQLMDEYCDNAKRIDELKSQELERGAWSGNIDERSANRSLIILWMLQARQYTIKSLLHGQTDISGEYMEQEYSAINTLGDYANHLFHKMFVIQGEVEFRV